VQSDAAYLPYDLAGAPVGGQLTVAVAPASYHISPPTARRKWALSIARSPHRIHSMTVIASQKRASHLNWPHARTLRDDVRATVIDPVFHEET